MTRLLENQLAFALFYPPRRYRSALIGILVRSSQSVVFGALVVFLVTLVAIERRKRMNHLLSIKKPKFMAISMTIMLALVILLSTSGSATGQENGAAPGRNGSTAQPPQQQGPTDPAELEAFLDEELGREMEKHHIAGAAVSVVKDGKLFFAKGYGDADLKKGIPVDPEQTTFRIGSITKLFTWTAVMQLAEQGKLDLDADVNDLSRLPRP